MLINISFLFLLSLILEGDSELGSATIIQFLRSRFLRSSSKMMRMMMRRRIRSLLLSYSILWLLNSLPQSQKISLRISWPYLHTAGGPRPWGGWLCSSWHTAQTLHTGPVAGISWDAAGLQFMSKRLISLPVLWWFTWAVLLCLYPPQPLCSLAPNNIRMIPD